MLEHQEYAIRWIHHLKFRGSMKRTCLDWNSAWHLFHAFEIGTKNTDMLTLVQSINTVIFIV